MNYIFTFLILISFICAIINNSMSDLINDMLKSSQKAVEISIGLIGIMAFWLGIRKIAEKSGLVQLIAKAIKPITKKLFNELDEDSPAIGDIAMNFTANAFGLANAATPFGIRAMENMQVANDKKDTASNSMCLFLAMNTAGFQLVPATVIAILVGIGYKNPTEIIAPTLLVTSIAFVSAIAMAKVAQYITKKKGVKND